MFDCSDGTYLEVIVGIRFQIPFEIKDIKDGSKIILNRCFISIDSKWVKKTPGFGLAIIPNGTILKMMI